jgi:hypothetical protein
MKYLRDILTYPTLRFYQTSVSLEGKQEIRHDKAGMSLRTQELKQLLEEIEITLAETRSLRAQTNSLAVKLGLKPI